MESSKRVYIVSANQCPRGRLDVTRIYVYFAVNGWKTASDPSQADLVIAGGCAFTAPVEDLSVGLLSDIRGKMKPGVPLVVCGCLAGINGTRVVESVGGVPISAASSEYLDQLINARVPLDHMDDANAIDSSLCLPDQVERSGIDFNSSLRGLISHRFLRIHPEDHQACSTSAYEKLYYIRVLRGCLEECSYCAIRFANDGLCSKPPDAVLQEFDRGLEAGFKTFYLLGEDVGAYGQDADTSIVGLLRDMFGRTGDFRIVLSDFHPRWFVKYAPELIELFAENQERIGHVEMPVQSGSSRILSLMKRRYNPEDILKYALMLKKKAPLLHLKTHLVIGFPGETGEDFNKTLKLMRAVNFDRVICYQYSDRPGTEASMLPNKVPSLIKNLRHLRCRREFG